MTDRARVPFALIGVLLLVVSGTVAVSQHDPVVTEPSVDRAMDRLSAESQSALRSAVHRAARDAAAHPVVEPADTTAGAAINETRSFRDALRLRIYLAARANLARLDEPVRTVDRSATLPPIGNTSDVADVRRAIERVSVEPAGPDGQQLRVGIEGLTLGASRGDRLGGERRYSPTFVVDSPVLAVHDRVAGFEDRLNRYVGRPGLAARVSAVLYPVAWMRGYAQYRGQPIENVVANRHVALATNGALLSEQRRAFGASDPAGRWVYGQSLVDVGLTDLAATTDSRTLDRLEAARNRTGLNRRAPAPIDRLAPPADAPAPSDTTTVAVGRAADRAFLESMASRNETVAAAYAPAVRVRAAVRTLNRTVVRTHDASGSWTLEGERTYYDTTVRDGSGRPPESSGRWHRFDEHSRTVDVEKLVIRTWEKPDNDTAWTRRVVHYTRAVDLTVEGDHVVGPAPDGPIASVHEPGGPLDGPNLADARERVREHVETERGGPDRLAARAAIRELDTDPRSVQAARPAGIARWASADLPALRRQVRAIDVTVENGDVASFQRNVPQLLADRLRERRGALVDAPETYANVAERARVGVRAAYVDRVIGVLERRARQHDAAGDKLGDVLSTTGRAADLLTDGYATGAPRRLEPGAVGTRWTVDAAPAYLPTEAVDHRAVPATAHNQTEYPLVVRNLNGASIPASGVVDGLFGLLSGPAKTSLRTAAQVVRTAAPVDVGDGAAAWTTDALTDQVDANVAALRDALREPLADRDLGTERDRADVVASALDRYNGTSGRASALVNGSAAEAVHAAAVARWPDALDNATDRDRLAVELDLAVVDGRERPGPRPVRATVNRTAAAVRDRLADRAEQAVDEAVADATTRARERVEADVRERVEKRTAAVAARLPSGVPLVPAPGLWYATVNAWHVEMRGSYARFAVRTPRGSPDRLPATLTYVRENATATLDLDRDGEGERLGHNRRITFTAETVVAVAVPPGAQGVGDVDERDERSPGWPTPGPVENATEPPATAGK